jgi:hypothetical protein
MKPYLIYIIAALLMIAGPFICRSQNADSIVVISSTSVQKDTAAYSSPKARKIQAAARPDNFWRRVSVGGWLSFQFGTITGISVSPEVKVRAVNQLYPGAGFIYQYALYRDFYVDPVTRQTVDYSSSIIGARFFLRYYLSGLVDNFLGNFFAHTEYEYLSYVGHTENYVDQVENINSIFVGGGYKQPISSRAFFDLLILFNLNDTPNSPYTNPVFRFGFGIGL